jgi:hypothetical protein
LNGGAGFGIFLLVVVSLKCDYFEINHKVHYWWNHCRSCLLHEVQDASQVRSSQVRSRKSQVQDHWKLNALIVNYNELFIYLFNKLLIAK